MTGHALDSTTMQAPGTLDWQPLLDRPELVADPTVAAARELDGIELLSAPIDATLADTAAFCEAYDVPEAASANCVIISGRRGEITTTAAVMILATDRADINKVVRKHLGVRKVSFAPQAEATSRTRMEYGGITPIGLPSDWPVLVDTRVTQAGPVVIGGGRRGSKICIDGADLTRLPGAEALDLAITS